MSENISNRVVQLMTSLGLSQNAFAKAIGTSSAMVSQVANGKDTFRVDLAQKIISTFPGVNAHWLMTGKGEMFNSETVSEWQVKRQVDRQVSEKPKNGKNTTYTNNQEVTKRDLRTDNKLPESDQNSSNLPSQDDIKTSPAAIIRDSQREFRRNRSFERKLLNELEKENPELLRFKQSLEDINILLDDTENVCQEYLYFKYNTQEAIFGLTTVGARNYTNFNDFKEAAILDLKRLLHHKDHVIPLVDALRTFLKAMMPYDSEELITEWLFEDKEEENGS